MIYVGMVRGGWLTQDVLTTLSTVATAHKGEYSLANGCDAFIGNDIPSKEREMFANLKHDLCSKQVTVLLLD